VSNRDIFYSNDAARLAAFDAIVRLYPRQVTMPVVLNEAVSGVVSSYRKYEGSLSLEQYIREINPVW
jgi:hypothetical protein